MVKLTQTSPRLLALRSKTQVAILEKKSCCNQQWKSAAKRGVEQAKIAGWKVQICSAK